MEFGVCLFSGKPTRQVKHPFCNSPMIPFSGRVCLSSEICAYLFMLKVNKVIWLQKTLLCLQNQTKILPETFMRVHWHLSCWMVMFRCDPTLPLSRSNCHVKAHISRLLSTTMFSPNILSPWRLPAQNGWWIQ